MKTFLALLAAAGLAFAAKGTDVWTYFIQPCTPEISRATGCNARDPELAQWALEAWARTSAGAIEVRSVEPPRTARMRVLWVDGNKNQNLYGETHSVLVDGERGAELYIMPAVSALGEEVAAKAKADRLFRDSIVYLTCLHEAGHGFGLKHTNDFEDIMYSFQYGGDIPGYFERYRTKLQVREDIKRNSGLNDADAKLLKSAVRKGNPK